MELSGSIGVSLPARVTGLRLANQEGFSHGRVSPDQYSHHVSRHHSGSLPHQHAADRRPRQADRAHHRHHHWHTLPVEKPRSILNSGTKPRSGALSGNRGGHMSDPVSPAPPIPPAQDPLRDPVPPPMQ